MQNPKIRAEEIAKSPLSLAEGTYVDAWYLAKEVVKLRALANRLLAAEYGIGETARAMIFEALREEPREG